jgi:hypothetical protein
LLGATPSFADTLALSREVSQIVIDEVANVGDLKVSVRIGYFVNQDMPIESTP